MLPAGRHGQHTPLCSGRRPPTNTDDRLRCNIFSKCIITVSEIYMMTLLSYFLYISSYYYLLLELFPLIQVSSCRVKTDLCVLILFPGCRLTRLSCHGTLFSVFFLDHNENQPENQRKRKLQVHRYPRHLRL